MVWCTYKYWGSIELVKMFWNMLTEENDANLQHCACRFSKDDKLILYKFILVVMVLSDSPGLFRLALTELAAKFKPEYSLVPDIIEEDTYMDGLNVIGHSEKLLLKKHCNL